MSSKNQSFFQLFLQEVLVCRLFSFGIFRRFSCSHVRDLLFYQGFFSKRVCFFAMGFVLFFANVFVKGFCFFRKRHCLFSAVFFALFFKGFFASFFFFATCFSDRVPVRFRSVLVWCR